jgi:Leucine-rich repeat (LRR) protein
MILLNLRCSDNQLTAEAINAFFSDLAACGGYIYTGGNPGSSTCDRSLVTGWRVEESNQSNMKRETKEEQDAVEFITSAHMEDNPDSSTCDRSLVTGRRIEESNQSNRERATKEEQGAVEFTTFIREVNIYTSSGAMTVDWGDGKIKSYKYKTSITHTYVITFDRLNAKNRSHTIRVKAERFTQLNCSHKRLTALDVSRNPDLTVLNCGHNHLTALDVSRNTGLTKLECYDNRLTALDVSRNTALTELECGYNHLTALDVSRNTALTRLNCRNNQLTAEALNALFADLPAHSGSIRIKDNPGSNACDRSLATDKGWIFED